MPSQKVQMTMFYMGEEDTLYSFSADLIATGYGKFTDFGGILPEPTNYGDPLFNEIYPFENYIGFSLVAGLMSGVGIEDWFVRKITFQCTGLGDVVFDLIYNPNYPASTHCIGPGCEQIILDGVTIHQIVPCWECRFCRRGQYWMCDRKHDVYGFRQRTPGAMAEYMLFPADAINHKVPETLTPQQAVYIEPLACAIHAVQRGEIELGDTVVISGCGPLGLGMVAAARLKNPAAALHRIAHRTSLGNSQ